MLNNHKVIGLCITRLFEKLNYDLMVMINERAVKAGYRLIVFHCCTHFYESDTSEIGESRIYETLPFDVLDALIVCEETYGQREIAYKIIEDARSHNIPVFVHGIEHKGCVTFSYDYVGGFESVVRHIVESHKAKNPFFMGGIKDNVYSDERKDAFIRVCEENGISFDEETMVGYGQFWAGPTRDVMEELLKRDNLPDAIICANDFMAITVSEVLTEHCIRVPEDVMVSGFDGVEDIYYSNPQITSAVCSVEDMADKIMAYVVKALADGIYEEERIILMPRLLLLESCGCNNSVNVNGADQITKLTHRLNEFMDREQKLVNISSRIQRCKSIKEINTLLNREWLREFSVLVAEECLSDEKLLNISEKNKIPKKHFCIYDEDNGEFGEPELVNQSDGYKFYSKYIERENPVVLNVLHINECYLGMVSLHMDYMRMDAFYLLYQFVVSLKNGVVGYQREVYQQHISDQMIELYKTDALTNFYQRKALDIEYKRILNNIALNGGLLSVLLLDLDGLKTINDKYGHNEGDNAISVVADALKTATPRGTIMFRYGGDEFLALFRADDNKEELIRGNIKGYLDRYNAHSNLPYVVSTSIGMIVEENPNDKIITDLIELADTKMYKEKNEKKQQGDSNE